MLAYKKTTEAINGSVNRGAVVPAMRRGPSGPLLREYTATLKSAWNNNWHVAKVGSATVQSASTTGSRARLATCGWEPSFSFRDENDKVVGSEDPWWDKVVVTMASVSGRWIVSPSECRGKCPGDAPK